MTGKTHAIIGTLTGILTYYYLPNFGIKGLEHLDMYTTISSVAIGALIPDLDTRKSLASSAYPPISWISRLFVTHRGFTHLILPILLILGWYRTLEFFLFGFSLGIVSHTTLDLLTRSVGVTCDSVGEDIIYWVAYGVLVYLIWLRYNVPIMYVWSNVSEAFMYAYSTGNQAVECVKK